MSVNKKALKAGSTSVVDANLIYNRILGLHQSRGIQLDKGITWGSANKKTICEVNATLDDITAECTQFIAACYGCKNCVNMSLVHADVWSKEMAKPKLTKAPKLKSLPPTKAAFELHVLRAHVQTVIWKSANDSRPPELEPTKYG